MTAPAEPDERPRVGRPRDEHCDRAIATAALDLLVEEGFGRMSMEGIAARAGVGKATIYRRWATKEQLLVDAVHWRCLDTPPAPDTGDVRTDLIAVLRSMVERFQRDGRVMQSFAAEQGRHRELAEAFRTTFLAGRRAAIRAIIDRGVARGQLPEGTDVELVADAGPALLWHRLTVTGARLDQDLPDRIVAQFLPSAQAETTRRSPRGPGRPASGRKTTSTRS